MVIIGYALLMPLSRREDARHRLKALWGLCRIRYIGKWGSPDRQELIGGQMTCYSCGRRPQDLCAYWDGCPYEEMHSLIVEWQKNADHLLEDAKYMQEKLDLRMAAELRERANLLKHMASELRSLIDRKAAERVR